MTGCRQGAERPEDILEQGDGFTAAALRVARDRFEGRGLHPAVYSWGERGRRLYLACAPGWPDVIDDTVWQALQDDPSHVAVMVYAVREDSAWHTSPRGNWAMVSVADLTSDAEPVMYCAEFPADDGPLGPWFVVVAAPLH